MCLTRTHIIGTKYLELVELLGFLWGDFVQYYRGSGGDSDGSGDGGGSGDNDGGEGQGRGGTGRERRRIEVSQQKRC